MWLTLATAAADRFAPVSLLVLVPNVLAVNPQLPANTVQELIDLAKTEPLAYASSGNGTSPCACTSGA